MQFKKVMIHVVFLLFAVVATRARRLGGHHHQQSLTKDNKSDGFPNIYTVRFSSPLTKGAEAFLASLDILKTSSDDAQKMSNGVTVTFMVHSGEELKFIRDLAAKESIKSLDLDLEATKTYMAKIKPENDVDVKNTDSTINNYPCYRNLAGMEALMQDLVKQAESIPNLEVTLTDIGDSYLKSQNATQGYDIWALNITGSGVSSRGMTTKKGVLFGMTGIHAREYAPPELAARFLEMLVDGYGSDSHADITSVLDHTEIHWVLNSNPDGRFQAEQSPSLFRRKNLNGSPTVCGEGGYGVDLNRNFPFKWGGSGSSSFPCSQTYRGASPASEPEVQAIVNYVSSIFPEAQRKDDPEEKIDEPFNEDIAGIFFDLHSFGEIIIWPWSYANKETGNDQDLEALVQKYQSSNRYDFSGPNNNFLYPASGVTDDWAYGVLGIPGMTFELGTEFYQDCGYFENNVVPRNLPALLYSAKTATAPFLLSKGPDVTSLVLSQESLEMKDSSSVSITAEVSDSALSSAGFPSAQQTIASVRVFVDTHPNDVVNEGRTAAPEGLEMESAYASGTETATLSLTFGDLKDLIQKPVLGRHTLYVQATDSEGYAGPVAAVYVEIVEDALTSECEDSEETFIVDTDLVGERSCDWLSISMFRFSYLCDRIEVGRRCPKTCNHCDLFG